MSIEKWYVYYTKPRCENKAYQELITRFKTCFFPRQKVERQWKDRKKKIEVPLFPGYLFVKIKPTEIHHILANSYVVKAIKFGNDYAIIDDAELEHIQRMLLSDNTLFVEKNLLLGDVVEVISGPMAGMKGVLCQQKGQFRFAVNLCSLQHSLLINIDVKNLQNITEYSI